MRKLIGKVLSKEQLKLARKLGLGDRFQLMQMLIKEQHLFRMEKKKNG